MSRLLNETALKVLQIRGFELKTFEYRNTPVYYLEGGTKNKKKPVLTIFPGYGDSMFSWTHVLIALSKHAHLFILDFPNYAGFSKHPKKGKAMLFDDYCEVGELFLKNVVQKTDVLLGNSLGGWIASWSAFKNQKRVGHLVLVNTAGILSSAEEYLQIRETFVIKNYFDFLKFMKKLWYKMPFFVYPYSLLGYYQHTKKPHFKDVIFSIEGRHFLNESLKKTKLQISLVWGRHDKLFREHMAELFLNLVPHSHFYLFKKSGHMPQLEEPVRFIRLIRKILA